MAKIRKIYDQTIKPDGNKLTIYPITSTRAVYTPESITVEALINEGYRFGGVIEHLEDSPEFTDQRVFYLADKVGVYPNFGNLTLAGGELGVFCYNKSQWIKGILKGGGTNLTGYQVVTSVSLLPDEESTIGYIIGSDLYVWVGEGGDAKDGKYKNAGPFVGPEGNGIESVAIDPPDYKLVIQFTDGTSWESEDPVINLPNEDDLIIDSNKELKFNDRPTTYGKGYKILRRGSTFAEQVTAENTIYEIRYDFDLDGASVELPEKCILKFVGGCIKNGTLVGDHSRYIACGQVFDEVVLDGTFDNDLSVLDFGVKAIDSEDSEVIAALAEDNAEILAGCVIQSAENTKCTIVVPETFNEEYYYFDTPLELSGTYDFICKGLLFFTGDDETTALTIGATTVKLYNKNFEIRLRRSSMQYTDVDSEEDVPESVGVEIKNANDCTINLADVANFAYSVILSGDATGMCYNNIYLGRIGGYSFCALKIQAINNGWINENIFYGGHLYTFTTNPILDFNIAIDITAADSTHAVNCNLFLKPCMELNHTGIRFTKATGNTFLSVRLEAVTNPMDITDRNSSKNTVLYGAAFSSQNIPNNNTVSKNVTMPISEISKCVQKTMEFPIRVYQTPYSTNRYSYYSNLVMSSTSDTSELRGYISTSASASPTGYLFGWIINVYEGLSLIINSQHATRFVIKALDSDNVIYPMNTGTYTVYDYLEQSGGSYTFTTIGDIQTGADNTLGQLVFKDKITRAFVGIKLTDANETITLSVPDSVNITTLFRDNPIVPDTVPTIPSAVWNVALGDSIYVEDIKKFAFYNNSKFVDAEGRTLAPSYGSTRPTLASTDVGYIFYDTTANKSIVWNGTAWTNLDGTALA